MLTLKLVPTLAYLVAKNIKMISIHISYPHNSFLTQTYTEYDAKITVKGVKLLINR